MVVVAGTEFLERVVQGGVRSEVAGRVWLVSTSLSHNDCIYNIDYQIIII